MIAMNFSSLACAFLLTASAAAGDFSVRRFAVDPAQACAGAVSVQHADLIYSGQLWPVGGGDLAKQQSGLWKQATDLLKSIGLAPRDIVKLNLYVADEHDAAAMVPALRELFGPDSLPAVSWVTTALPHAEARLGLDFIAARAASDEPFPASTSGQANLAIIRAAATSRVFISGQAEKGDGSVADAARQTMASLFRTLSFVDLKPADVVQVKAFISPMSQSAEALTAIRAAFTPAACPPLVLVEWESPSLPVEIELVASGAGPTPKSGQSVRFLTPPGLKSSPVFSRVARVHSPTIIFLSGIYGTQPDPDSEAELRELFARTKTLAETAGSDLRHLVKATYYVSSAGSSQQHNKLRPEYYDPARPPAASKAIVKGVGRAGRTITWDMIAVPKE